ncbi:serine acetyltransferase 1, chloroplastic-like protein [Tanacetum coccineum]
MAYIIRQVKSSSIVKINPNNVDKNDTKDVQLQDEDIMYDIDLYFVSVVRGLGWVCKRVSEVFALDIQSGARNGSGILLDHTIGVVIGEPAVIGNNVWILHNVTLGGTGKSSGDRHSKIGDGVLMDVGTCVLGNIWIGDGAKIGAGCRPLHRVSVVEKICHRRLVAGKTVAAVVGSPENRFFELSSYHLILDIRSVKWWLRLRLDHRLQGLSILCSCSCHGFDVIATALKVAQVFDKWSRFLAVPSNGSGRSSVTEQPLERLLKVVKTISPATLSASVSDIGSVVSMTDRIAGSTPELDSTASSSIKRPQVEVWKSVGYGVSKCWIRRIQVLDTAYWGFLGVGTTLDIFQNIQILYLEYGVLSFIPLWSLVSAGTDTPYLP